MGKFKPLPHVVGFKDEQDIEDAVYSSLSGLKLAPGTICCYVTDDGAGGDKVSYVRLYKAGATITQGAPLTHANGLVFETVNPNILFKASASQAGHPAAGIAAANVSNTGYYSWAYVYGYCPAARVSTAIASGAMLTIGGSTNGLSSLQEATLAATSGKLMVPFAVNHYANTDIATLSSITITRWLG